MLSGAILLTHVLDAFAARRRFSGAAVAEYGKAVLRAIMFDIATTSTIALRAKEKADAERRGARSIEAIGEFDATIGEVIAAINESSGSLTETSSIVQHIAEDTLRRMASASAVSAETTQSVDHTVTATEELSESIREIGSRPRAVSKWPGPRSPTPSAPTRPSARWTRRPSVSVRWSG